MIHGMGSSLRRFGTVMIGDLAYNARRPLFIIWALILVLSAWGLSTGFLMIQSGDATVGGTKAHITSEFSVAQQLAIVTMLFYAFFLTVVAGMAIIQDDEWRLGELIHATPLRPREYIWGKFAAVVAGCIVILLLHLVAIMFFQHLLPNARAQEIRGPFHVLNYLRPMLMFSLPTILFYAGVSFLLGEWTRRPVLVFLLPVALLIFVGFFLWEWSPSWLDPRIDRALMLIDPSGWRWLNETWLKVDRGVAFYNTAAIPLDAGFVASRVAMVLIGLGSVALAGRHFAATVRGATSRAARRSAALMRSELEAGKAALAPELSRAAVAIPAPLASLGMTMRRPGLLRGAWHVARSELAELRSSPGLYLFIPLLLLQTLVPALIQVGPFETYLLVTPAGFAVGALRSLTTCLCLLLLFYAVESLERERSTRLAAIALATPIRTSSILLGKLLALGAVALAIVGAVTLGGIIAILIQGEVRLNPRPFLVYWGVLLVPTTLLWIAFVMVVHAITQSRYATYAVAIGVLIFTGYRYLTDQINWVGNWPMWQAAHASDMSVMELDRTALVLSRVAAVALAVFFAVLTIRFYRRREPDATRILHRLSPRPLSRAAIRLAPWGLVPLVAVIWLALEVSWGHEGGAAMKQEKDYWRKNLATYRDAKIPDLRHVTLHLDLFPDRGRYHSSGTYDVINTSDKPLREVLLTGGPHWEKLSWTLDGQPYKPNDRANLFVFTPTGGALAPGQSMRIGFEHEGTYPRGISAKGGTSSEFILPSGVVLTSFRPTIAPMLGFQESIGIDDDNRHDSREYPDDYFEGQTETGFGSRAPFTTRITITGPADFTLNSVGILTEDSVKDGRRTAVWESDHPVSFFNVIAGRWAVERGEGTAVYYHPGHRYNIDEMREALDAARRYYSQWFYPYPWRELKLSEFANLATYAQGFPTNITFSEGIGFLAYRTPEIHSAFEITCHESAHQWWGSIVTPGRGPGANIVAEGTSHFSTILLIEQVKGLNARIDFCKRLEANYGRSRQVDSERPLVKIDGDRPGDPTVTYDKGGWVFWMLLNHMGRERALAGIQAFMKTYHGNPDHPVLQDLVAAMRPFASDPSAFDAFTRQWFFEVVVPEYQLTEPRKTAKGSAWDVKVRIQNVGSGTMPVEVAATRGERFAKDGSPSPDYREARTTLTLGKGESGDPTFSCDFEPDRIIVDPDAKVLQLRRKSAVTKF
jgi:ABC-2 type transport system permease protein